LVSLQSLGERSAGYYLKKALSVSSKKPLDGDALLELFDALQCWRHIFSAREDRRVLVLSKEVTHVPYESATTIHTDWYRNSAPEALSLAVQNPEI